MIAARQRIMTDKLFNQPAFQSAVQNFEPISLTEMDSVRLLDRQDTKLVLSAGRLPDIMKQLARDYRILEIKGRRVGNYSSLYYDTAEWDSYHEHHNGRKNRYKVRYRNYIDSGISFFEIKHKTNKNRTVKTRIQTDSIKTELGLTETILLERHTPLDPHKLKPAIWIYYSRMTLVSRDMSERVTIDIDLEFEPYNETASIISSPKLAIIEIKQQRFSRKSLALRTLHDERIFPIRLSKYCLGVMSCCNGEVKRNGFKNKLFKIAKITNDDFYRSLATC